MRTLDQREISVVGGGDIHWGLPKEDWRLISGVGIGFTGGALITTAIAQAAGATVNPAVYLVELALLGASLGTHFALVERLD